MQDCTDLPTINRIKAALPAGLLILAGTIGLGAAELRPQPKPGVPLGVYLAGQKSSDALRVIAAADGRLVTFGGWLGTPIAVSDDPDFAAKLYRAGATLVFRADGAVGCADMTRSIEPERT